MANAELISKLQKIQGELRAPKDQYNKFGGYNYRSCESILESVKPLLQKYGCVLTLSDQMTCIEGRHYLEATARLADGESEICVTACAREAESKKGMDASQITGATSSYARKYALNGLFCIDDAKDADRTITCKKCGEPITGERLPNGTILTDQDVAKETQGYCRRCVARKNPPPAKQLAENARAAGVPVQQDAEAAPAVRCKQCGKPIVDAKTKDGRIMPAQVIIRNWGGLCADCVKYNAENENGGK